MTPCSVQRRLGLLAVVAAILGCTLANSLHDHRASRGRLHTRRSSGPASSSASSSSSSSSSYDSEYAHSNWQSDIDWSGTSGRAGQPKCVDIPKKLDLCKDIGYTSMRLPNLLGHDTLEEVTQQARVWVALSAIGCHKYTQLFLCSLFTPVCLERDIFPCMSLCESVKEACLKRMKTYGFPWPDMLRCDKFPKDNDLCIKKVGNSTREEDNICEACKQPGTMHSLIDNYCQSDFVLRMKVSENLVIDQDSALVAMKKKKKYKKGNLTKTELRSLRVYLKGGAKCDCPLVTNKLNKGNFIVMGKRVAGRLEATFIQEFDRKNKIQKKGLRKAQKDKICKEGLKALSLDDSLNGKTKPKQPSKAGTSKVTSNGVSNGKSENPLTTITKHSKKNGGKKERRRKHKRRDRTKNRRNRKNRKQTNEKN